MNNEEDAEECVNDAYLNAWYAIPPHWPEQLATFLGKITRNLLINTDTIMPKNGVEAKWLLYWMN